MKIILCSVAVILFFTAAAQPQHWAANVNTGAYGSLNTNFTLLQKGSYYYGTTKPGANKRIVGGVKGALAKGSFQKDGSVMELDSIEIKDNAITGFLILEKKKYFLRGTMKDRQVLADITGKTSGKVYGRFEAEVVDAVKKPKDYKKLWNELKSLTEKYIYRKNVLDSKEWKNFVQYMDDFSGKAEDDGEFLYAFFYKSKDLPFSHYSLTGHKDTLATFAVASSASAENNSFPSISRLDSAAFLLDIPAFNFRANVMDSLMTKVLNSSATNLIIDLRNNPGGDLEGAMKLCEYISSKTLYGGVVLSQAYWQHNQLPPAPEDYTKFKVMSNANYAWFRTEIDNGIEGLCIMTNPLQKTFKGKIYVLTSSMTASTAEPLVYTLQKENIATVIGSKTAGAVVSMQYFYAQNFDLSIPILDYYTFDGKRLDNNGVEPNISCKPEDALLLALAKIKEGK